MKKLYWRRCAGVLLLICIFTQLFGFSSVTSAAPMDGVMTTGSEDLALNKPATSSAEQGNNPTNSGNDGDSATRWCADNGDLDHWWKVDLGQAEYISGTEVDFESTGSYQYKIEVSNDDENWITKVDRRDNSDSQKIFSDDFTASARYLKITITGLPENKWASFWGFKVKSGTAPSDIDTDGDGILDYLERDGFMVVDNQIQPWNGDKTVQRYQTDPNNASTTGDPYNDRVKTTGTGMDRTVLEPASENPLVAAYPDVKVYLNSFDVILLETITDSKGGSKSGTYSNSLSKKDEQTHGASLTVKQGGSFTVKAGLNAGVEKSFSYEVSAGYQGSHNWGTTASVTNSDTDSVDWYTAKTTKPDQAAKLRLNLEYKNVGTAPIKDVQVKYNVRLGNKIIATVASQKWGDIPSAALLTTSKDPSQQKYGPFVQEQSSNGPIYVTLDELKSIQLGTPITIEPIEIKGNVIRWDSDIRDWKIYQEWNVYKGQIAASTATLVYEQANGMSKTYKVAAKTNRYDPHMMIGNAVFYTMGAEVRDDGIYVNGKKLDNNWSYYFSDASFGQRLDEQVEKGNGLFDIELEAGETVYVKEPKQNPEPKIHWAKYNADYKRIYANISAGDYGIKSVMSNVMINGEEQDVELTSPDGHVFYFNEDLFTDAADASYRATITATDEKGNIVEKTIEPSEEKQGLKYKALDEARDLVPLNTSRNKGRGSYDANLSQYPNAQAFVVQVESDRWSAENIEVNVGGVKTNLATADIVKRNYKVKFIAKNGTEKIIEGTELEKNVSQVTNVGILHDSIIKIENFGDDGFTLELYEQGNYSGNMESIYLEPNQVIDLNTDYTSLKDKISSFRIVCTGGPIDGSNPEIPTRGARRHTLSFIDGDRYHNFTIPYGGTGYIKDVTKPYNWLSHDSVDDITNNSNDTYVALELYEHGNFGGNKRSIILAPGERKRLSDINFINRLSSFKFRTLDFSPYVRGAENSPIASKTLVVPRIGDTLPINWTISDSKFRKNNGQDTDAHIKVKLLGYFSEDEGYKFSTTSRTKTFTESNGGIDNTNTNISTGVSDATALLYKIKSSNISADDINVTINGVSHHFGTPNSRDYRDNTAGGPTRSDILFVPVIGNNSSTASVNIDISDSSKVDFANSSIELELVGYFSELGELKYIPFNTSPKSDFLPVTWSPAENWTEYDLRQHILKNTTPEAFLVNFNILDSFETSESISRTANGEEVNLGTYDSSVRISYSNQNRKLKSNHTTMDFVLVDPTLTENPYTEAQHLIRVNHNVWEDYIKFEALGYFH